MNLKRVKVDCRKTWTKTKKLAKAKVMMNLRDRWKLKEMSQTQKESRMVELVHKDNQRVNHLDQVNLRNLGNRLIDVSSE